MDLAIITADGQIHDVELSAPLRELARADDPSVDEAVGFAVLMRADELLGTPAETRP